MDTSPNDLRKDRHTEIDRERDRERERERERGGWIGRRRADYTGEHFAKAASDNDHRILNDTVLGLHIT